MWIRGHWDWEMLQWNLIVDRCIDLGYVCLICWTELWESREMRLCRVDWEKWKKRQVTERETLRVGRLLEVCFEERKSCRSTMPGKYMHMLCVSVWNGENENRIVRNAPNTASLVLCPPGSSVNRVFRVFHFSCLLWKIRPNYGLILWSTKKSIWRFSKLAVLVRSSNGCVCWWCKLEGTSTPFYPPNLPSLLPLMPSIPHHSRFSGLPLLRSCHLWGTTWFQIVFLRRDRALWHPQQDEYHHRVKGAVHK